MAYNTFEANNWLCVSLYSFAQIGKKGERKEDLTRAKFNDSRFIFTYEVNKLLLRSEVE